jgi:hypothetical protein
MKVFLFLYPIKPFFENEIGNFYQFRNGKYDVRRLNDIIRARYRKKNQIVWLLFGQENAPNKPDKDLLASWITIEPEDTIISAGLSFKEHTQHRKYPNPESIFGQNLKYNRDNSWRVPSMGLRQQTGKLRTQSWTSRKS